MYRSDEQMSVRDEKCREIADAFGRAGVGSRHNRMPLMGCSSIVAWAPAGPTGQCRAVVTVDDAGRCAVYLSEVCEVAEGSSGEDMLGGLPAPLLCSLPASTAGLGEIVLGLLREAGAAEARSSTCWAGSAATARA